MKQTIEFKYGREVELPQDMIDSVPSSGPADSAVSELLDSYDVQVSLTDSIKYLRSTGGWTVEELQDIELNKSRLVWLACLFCAENNINYFYMGE